MPRTFIKVRFEQNNAEALSLLGEKTYGILVRIKLGNLGMYHPSLTILNKQGFPNLQVTMQSFRNPRKQHDVNHLNNVGEQNQ
jgi:hypothetical protein